jgi:hypothetical protein
MLGQKRVDELKAEMHIGSPTSETISGTAGHIVSYT